MTPPLGKNSLKAPWAETFKWYGVDGATIVFDWRLFGGNGELICSSHQGFTSQSDAERAALKAKDLFSQITEVRSA